MIKCQHCQTPNMAGIFYCEECGTPLLEEVMSTVATQKLAQTARSNQSANSPTVWGTAYFKRDTIIMLHLQDDNTRLTLQPKTEILLGRHDDRSRVTPDIDLTPFEAIEKGVSRIHAAIRRSEDTLTLVDLESVNGTFLNGQRVQPNQPRILRDGDEVSLGKLALRVYFK